MRKQRDEQNFRRALRRQILHGGFDGRILIPHRQFHRHADTLLEQRLNVLARDDQRRTFLRPDFFVGVRRFLWDD